MINCWGYHLAAVRKGISMLQIKNIRKMYITGDLAQTALDDVSFNLRDNEFVSILGQSGSGKTTLLNIIGGLDRYDSGDIVINGISTKKYKDRDWDSYRNHTIGFVFQSYNLIMHQSVLANVELALTISGVSPRERKKRAKDALKKVGLGDQVHKKPNQLSGGQMQRVAIARALVNDPEILLADEPTGALDSETSITIMELLKEVAKDRLVVMVTHNAELAEEYSNRIIELRDGQIISDTNPFEFDDTVWGMPKHKNMGKSSMSFFTALSLSFNNLSTKKGRTLLTSFAGSIGIIGISLILALSNGASVYIDGIQRETMASYPITIDAQAVDLMGAFAETSSLNTVDHELDGVYANSDSFTSSLDTETGVKENNLAKFRDYLDDPESEIHQYTGANGIVYSYNVKFDVYTYDEKSKLINTDGSTFNDSSSLMSSSSPKHFEQLLPGSGENFISTVVTDNYDVVYGQWPTQYNEMVFLLDRNNEISTSTLYELGLLPASEYEDILKTIKEDGADALELEDYKLNYADICSQKFYLLPASDYYTKNDNDLFEQIDKEDEDELKNLLENSIELKITGIIRLADDATYSSITANVGYTIALTDYIIYHSNSSDVVTEQEKQKDVNVLNGMTFEPKDSNAKIKDTKKFISSLGTTRKAAIYSEILNSIYHDDPTNLLMKQSLSESELAEELDDYLEDKPDKDILLSLYKKYIVPGSYKDNMNSFGQIDLDTPSTISIYADSFDDKEAISKSIENYNSTLEKEDQVTYTDYVEFLMSSMTTIITGVTYILIAFVAVALLVACIMIGIITYISVLERTKEIGVLRAIGASKQNISQVFNAETFIIGLFSGGLGVGLTLLMLAPVNFIIEVLMGSSPMVASLPITSAVLLIVLSVMLTLISGLIPARKAAKKDPVSALRSD